MEIKMKRYSIILTLFTTLISTNFINSQSANFYFVTAIPINDYRQFDSEEGYGANFEIFFLSPTKEKPIGMGISFSYFGQGLYFYDDPCGCESYLSNNRANNFINTHLVFQLSPTGGTVRPYIETLFGGSYIFSDSDILTLDYVPVNLYLDDWAWSYGVGGGIKFLLGGDEDGSLYLDLNGRYLMSSDVMMLDRESIRYAGDTFYYTLNETQLNFLAIQIGVTFYFR